MKLANFIWFFVVIVGLSGEVSWLSSLEHNFGDIPRYQPVKHSFQFKNEGSKPLLIDNVRTTCGCTASHWPQHAIPPGETDAIEIEYDARAAGRFQKQIKVFFNGVRKPAKLRITGYVVED